MRGLISFMKKEWLEQLRSGKLMILLIIFVLLGIMSPAIAKLTPWLIEMLTESQGQNNMTITVGDVSALDSWVQFFKNAPMGLIAFILIQSSIFTKEYQSGTLVLLLTKGLDRYKVVVSKTIMLSVLWMAGYFLCFGVTYGYNSYFWDNSSAQNLTFSVIIWWLFGMLTISLTVLFSTLVKSNTGVLAGTGGLIFVSYLLGLLPKINKYLPTMLMDCNSLIYGLKSTEDYTTAIIVTSVLCVFSIAVSIPIFNKKHI